MALGNILKGLRKYKLRAPFDRGFWMYALNQFGKYHYPVSVLHDLFVYRNTLEDADIYERLLPDQIDGFVNYHENWKMTKLVNTPSTGDGRHVWSRSIQLDRVIEGLDANILSRRKKINVVRRID